MFFSLIILNIGYSIHFIVEDLWAHLAKASNKPVAEVMSGWTQQLGYPVLSVEGKQVCLNDAHVHVPGALIANQVRMLIYLEVITNV